MAQFSDDDYTTIEVQLNYAFHNRDLLLCAMTHPSYLGPHDSPLSSYERLEFIGDRVLGLVISDLLMNAFPKAEEGELARRLNALVRKEACAKTMDQLHINHLFRLSQSEIQSAGSEKVTIKGDICEAIIGAIYLDSGLQASHDFIKTHWQKRLLEDHRQLRDPKTQLQEWLQGQGKSPPGYDVIDQSGPDHAPVFSIQIKLEGFEPAIGEGTSKKQAEQAAAQVFLERENLLET